MDLLIVEPLDPVVLQWLMQRHRVEFAPALAVDARALARALEPVRAAILPPSVRVDAALLEGAPWLQAIGRLSAALELLDGHACRQRGIEVVRPGDASAPAEAEFAIMSLLSLLRRVPVVNSEGLRVGRELGDCRVGIVGMTAAAPRLAALLKAFGARVVGYDPALHPSDPSWAQRDIDPAGLLALMADCDAVVVLLEAYPRYRGLFGARLLEHARAQQVIVSLSPSTLFDDRVLAQALREGRLAAVWMDAMAPATTGPGQPLADVEGLQVSPRISATTQGSRLRSAWAVARRIDRLLSAPSPWRRPADEEAVTADRSDAPPSTRHGGPPAGQPAMSVAGAAGVSAAPVATAAGAAPAAAPDPG